MIYKITIWIVRGLLVLLNGFGDYQGREKVPKRHRVLLVAPHRSWLDPVMMALLLPQPRLNGKTRIIQTKTIRLVLLEKLQVLSQ